MDTLLSFPVLDVIAGFIVVLIGLFMAVAIIAWKQYKRANWLAAELNGRIIHQKTAEYQLGGMITYINTHRSTWQQPGFPSDEFTVDWMAANGIRKHDAQALIYKYLSKALRPDENN